MAALPNIRVKLGGLGMKVSRFPFYEAALLPSSVMLAKVWGPFVPTSSTCSGSALLGEERLLARLWRLGR